MEKNHQNNGDNDDEDKLKQRRQFVKIFHKKLHLALPFGD